jgi:hypothetical protein
MENVAALQDVQGIGDIANGPDDLRAKRAQRAANVIAEEILVLDDENATSRQRCGRA